MASDDTITPRPEPPLTRIQSNPESRRGSVGFAPGTLQRRRSTQDRIEEILEIARSRAESLEASGQSPHLTMMWTRSGSNVGGDIREEDGELSPDESTAMAVGGAPNYQSTATSTASISRERRGPRKNMSQGISNAQPRPPAAMQDNGAGGTNGHALESETKMEAFFSQFRSIELENKGSTARDHLALERTFLAWLRTSLAFASIGIAITQLFRLNTSISNGDDNDKDTNKAMRTLRQMGKPLGATFLGISVIILFLGYRRYFQAQQWVMRGKFPASRGTIILVAFIAFALMIASLVVVLVIEPTAV